MIKSTTPTEIHVYWNARMKGLQGIRSQVNDFFNGMSMRLAQGHARYGAPRKEAQYHTRMNLELAAYKKTGNAEHLLNLANYCFLETVAPQHPDFHWDNSADSVTRGRI